MISGSIQKIAICNSVPRLLVKTNFLTNTENRTTINFYTRRGSDNSELNRDTCFIKYAPIKYRAPLHKSAPDVSDYKLRLRVG
jgi:hypothetical protein